MLLKEALHGAIYGYTVGAAIYATFNLLNMPVESWVIIPPVITGMLSRPFLKENE